MTAQARQALLLLAEAIRGGDGDDIEALWWHARQVLARCAELTPQGSVPDRILTALREGATAIEPAKLRAWAAT